MTLGQLICGDSAESCIANDTLDFLSGTIDRFSTKAISYLNSGFNDEAQNFWAFCSRVVLETCCAAIIGRFDPFRLVYLSELQAQGNLKYHQFAKSGFRWSGDVIDDVKQKSDSKSIWKSDNEISKVSRSLFSPYADHIYWRPAFEKMIDFLNRKEEDSYTKDFKFIDPEKFTVSSKGVCSNLYSTLSKGVHWEFFAPTKMMDEPTLKGAMRNSLLQVGNLGLVSHFVSTAYRSLTVDDALKSYRTFRGAFQ